MSFEFVSLRIFVSNYVLYSFGLILRYFFRFLHFGDAKKELIDQQPPPAKADGTERNHFHDPEVVGFPEELANFLFWSGDFHEGIEEREPKTEYSVSKETHSDIHEDSLTKEVQKEYMISKEIGYEYEDGIEEDESIFMESDPANFAVHEDCEENGKEVEGFVHGDREKINEDETKCFVSIKNDSDLNHDNMKKEEKEIEELVLEIDSDVHEDGRKIDGNEKESSVFMENISCANEKEEKIDAKTEDSVFVENDTVTTTSKYEFLSEKSISAFMEEPTTLRFSFREYYSSPDISKKLFSELESEKDSTAQEGEEEEESVESNGIPFQFKSEVFGGTDSSDNEDYFIFNENSVTSDSESESSTSSGLIWGNINKLDDSFSYQFLGGKNGNEGFNSEILKVIMSGERIEENMDEKVSEFGVHEVNSQNGYIEIEPSMRKSEEKVTWEKELGDSESDEDDDLEWEHDDLVEQLKLELRNSRQGGLATILEEEEKEEEEEEEEIESPKFVVEELKPLKIEEKVEYKDQIHEIEKVYKSYTEKMRKLDILNYQTMHALGLVQLKDPLKLISIPKSIIQSAKPMIISQNLWPRKGTKISSDPLLKLVHELHRDLELVYVGQVCLSWEILCWQHKKAIELQQYDSQGSHRYNHVAGEFQLFQVLLQRFIENEPFQSGTRIQNYVKNRCVIRNLLHIPAIKDDSKGSEENIIASGKLADIIKDSMRVFWEFVRADRDYGNVIHKVSKQIGSDLKDPAISALLVDIRTQLQKKERRLKDIVRSGNCIVKKFQKHHEDQLDHEQLVAQVGLRLISRVVNMTHLRKEQVLWCNEKLHRIKFLSRKVVQVEPSFLLFPS